MYLVYIDEVKHDPTAQQYYWLCGLAIPEEDILSIETALDEIAESYFGCKEISQNTELHGQYIVQGKGPCKGGDLGKRVELFKKIASVIDNHEDIGRIVVRLDSKRISRKDLQTIAFMFLVERVNDLMSARKSNALLIVDHDAQFVDANVRKLAEYRAEGTDFAYGRDINHVVDTVHHTHSHHSRLLQLADIYVYSKCLCANEHKTYPKSEIVKFLNGLQNYYATKYKYWPPD